MLSTEETPKHNNLKEKFVLLPARKYAYRTKPCKYFENGCCRYGRKCRFIHTTNSKPCEAKQRVDILKLEMEKKLEEFQTIIMAQASEIADLKRCLQDLLASNRKKILWIPKINRAAIFQNQKIAVLVLYNM